MRGCQPPGTGRITAAGSSRPRWPRILQRKRRPMSNVDSMMVLQAKRCQCALLLKPQKAPGELDHAAAAPGIAGFGEALFPRPRTALVRRARQTGVARHRFAVTHWSRQHLIDEHISRFNADAGDPGHLPNHGVVPGLRLLLQPFLTGVLDLPDLTDDKA